jgi:CheY-like chemotaxis protein
MDANQILWNEKAAKGIIERLQKRRMEGSYAATADKAREEILEMIPKGATVFRCGSMTAVGMGLWEAIGELPEVTLIDPYQAGISGEEGLELRRKGLTADVMIASANMTNAKKTILIIEDDVEVLDMLVRHLEHLGYHVITASDGMEGLKKLDSEDYDLVVTDIVMPYVSGVGVVAAIKSKRPRIPVIAVTGYGKEPEAAAMEKNADLVLTKPVRISVLKEHVRELLELAERKQRP